MAIDALVDLAVGTLAYHFREDCVIVLEELATPRVEEGCGVVVLASSVAARPAAE